MKVTFVLKSRLFLKMGKQTMIQIQYMFENGQGFNIKRTSLNNFERIS